jgi:hypothetical protein
MITIWTVQTHFLNIPKTTLPRAQLRQIRRLDTRTGIKVTIPLEVAIITLRTPGDLEIVDVEIRAGSLTAEDVVVASFGVSCSRDVCHCDVGDFDAVGGFAW